MLPRSPQLVCDGLDAGRLMLDQRLPCSTCSGLTDLHPFTRETLMSSLRVFGGSRRTSAAVVRMAIHDSTPERIAASQMSAFTMTLEAHTGQVFSDYKALHDFSVREFRTFWQCFLHWSKGLRWSGSAEPVCVGDDCEHARFFPQAQLNYADNLLGLSAVGADAPALTACHADGRR